MNKTELISNVVKLTGLTLSDAAKSVDAVFQTIKKDIVEANPTTIKGFGSFSISNRAERHGINPSTKEPIIISARKVMKFKSSKSIEIK